MIKLYHGSQNFLSLREAKQEAQRLQIEEPANEIKIIDGDSTPASQIVEQITNIGMFATTAIFIIKRLSENKEKENSIEPICLASETQTILLWEETKIASNTKYYKQVSKYGEIVEFPEMNKREFKKWLAAELKTQNFVVNQTLYDRISENVNYSPERLISFLDKLSAGNINSISELILQENLENTLEIEIWDYINSLNSGDEDRRRRSALILKNLFDSKVEPLFILSMIIRNVRQLILIKNILTEVSDYKVIASKLKIPPFTLPALINSTKNWSEEKLFRVYEKIYNLDFEIKNGLIEPQLGILLLSTIL